MEAARQGRAGVRLIAVSKGASAVSVREAIAAGQAIFGENRVQEAEKKFAEIVGQNGKGGLSPIELHLIGPLQTNKAEDAVRLFDVIETLDRKNLAEALAKAIRKTGKNPQLYIEINSAGEPQKAGIAPGDLKTFLEESRNAYGLLITGLMCIPPLQENPEPYFRALKQLADAHGLRHISMGMSGDFETAIRCGATEVRIGTAIFGKRDAPQR